MDGIIEEQGERRVLGEEIKTHDAVGAKINAISKS